MEDKILLYHLRQINVTLVKNNCKSITSHMKKGKGACETPPPPQCFSPSSSQASKKALSSPHVLFTHFLVSQT